MTSGVALTLALAVALGAPLAVAQEAPGWDEPPYAGTLTLSSGFSDDPRTVDVTPGGINANPLSGPGCVGYIGSRPDVVVDYAAGGWDLTFSAASETDINLVVRDPYGRYHCDDDSGEGLNPVVLVSDPGSGRYAVWVGVFGASGEYVDGVFGVSEVGNEVTFDGAVGSDDLTGSYIEDDGYGGAVSGEVPGWDGEPYFGTTTLAAGFSGDPRTVAVNAGGTQANPLDGPGCAGSIGLRPDHVLQYTAGSYDLTFSAASASDLTLVVRDPAGRYFCDDDSGEGLNPRIDIAGPRSGAYRIWVGTFGGSGEMAESTLGISEIGAEAE